MNLLRKLKFWWNDPEPVMEEPESVEQPIAIPQPSGRIIRAHPSVDFSPDTHRHGGRIVKVMPKQLKQIKEAQERLSE